MLNSLRYWLIRLLGGEQTSVAAPPEQPGHHAAAAPHAGVDSSLHDTHVVPYDENLLERARTQWQFGDWDSLALLDRDTLQHHPDRAKLALLAAAGRLQLDKFEEARQYICLAQDWGVSKKLLARILAAGVHNSLGRAAAIAGEHPRALQNLQNSIIVVFPSSEVRLLAQVRNSQQYQQLGLLRVVDEKLSF